MAFVGACISGTELVTPPVQSPTAITLVFGPDSADLSTAVALGWGQGIPHAQVTITSDDSAVAPRLLAGSDSGTLFLDQLAGRYRIDAMRWLSDSERALLPAGDDAVGFLAHTVLITTGADPRTAVEMVASRRSSLLISEWKGDPLFTTSEGTYYFSVYLRLYNNGDTTVYLDGLIIGSGLASQFSYPNFPCSLYLPYALDPLGVWANWFYQLPGRGTDYPLLPGETAVLATDAIDHRPLFSEGLDLRGADFEFYGGAGDVDNPDVPNAADVGVRSDALGHGLIWSSLGAVAFVALPFDLATIQTGFFGNGTWGRIPASALLDVMAMKTTYQSGYPECSWLVHARFDRQAVQLLGARPQDDLLAYRRISVPFTIGGRPVLQHTHASAWDFTVKPRYPFAVP